MNSSIKLKNLSEPLFYNSSLMENLSKNLILCPPFNMVFHWSDALKTCHTVKSLVSEDLAFAADFKNCEKALNHLRTIPAWIKTDRKIFQTTMFDMYEHYILNHNNFFKDLNPNTPYKISFLSATGPYNLMSITECLNEDTYREFMMIFLLRGKITGTEFRLRLKSKILMEYSDEYVKSELINLEQLTSEGIIISMNSELYSEEYSMQRPMRILLNSKVVSSAQNKNLDEIHSYFSKYEYNLFFSCQKNDSITFDLKDLVVQSFFDFSNGKKMTLLIPFEKIAEKNSLIANNLKDFILHLKKLIFAFYDKDFELKKIA